MSRPIYTFISSRLRSGVLLAPILLLLLLMPVGVADAAAADGTFTGTGAGCNANGDTVIDAGDISCTVLTIFNGPGACSIPLNAAQMENVEGTVAPALAIPGGIEAQPDATVEIPIHFSSSDDVNTLAFSVDFDQEQLSLDQTDSNADGIPDVITVDLPLDFTVVLSYDNNDTDGEIDITIMSAAPDAALPSGTPVCITFETHPTTLNHEAVARFSTDPSPSFGTGRGLAVAGADAADRCSSAPRLSYSHPPAAVMAEASFTETKTTSSAFICR